MEIEIYKKNENNPIIINKWSEFFNYAELTTIEKFIKTYEFWNPIEKRALNSCKIFENLKQILNTEKILEFLNNREF